MNASTLLFADTAFFRAVRSVAPHLRTWPYVNVWLIGDVTHAYPLAITLREEGLAGRLRVHATSEEEPAVRRAREGAWDAEMIAASHAGYAAAGGRASLLDYFDVAGGRANDDARARVDDPLATRDDVFRWRGAVATVRADLRGDVVFAHHSPVTDSSFAEAQLIVCRGAFDRYGRSLRARAWSIAHESLCRFGVLAATAAELDGHPARGSYEPIAHGLYRRGDA